MLIDTFQVFKAVIKRVLSRPQQASLSPRKFKQFWTVFRNQSKSVPPNLLEMLDHYVNTLEFEKSSRIWLNLSKDHIEQLTAHGFEHYQLTIAKRAYWGEKFLNASQLETLVQESLLQKSEIRILKPLRSPAGSNFSS